MFDLDFDLNPTSILTEEIKRYIPMPNELFFKDKELKQRLIYYSSDYIYEDNEL